MNRLQYWAAVACVTLAAATVAPASAAAQGGVPNCSELQNPVYMAGTTAVVPVIRLLGARLKQLGVTLLWNENSSDGCGEVGNLAHPGQNQRNQRVVFTHYTEVAGSNGKVLLSTCNGGVDQVPDLVVNDVAYSSCSISYTDKSGGGLPNGLAEFLGPVQGLVPIVATSYTYYNDITVEELQDLYECGASGNILTFNSEGQIFDYNCINSGMRELWARGIGVENGAALDFKIGLGCNNNLSAETMVTVAIGASTAPNVTLGYTSTEFYDQYRDRVRALKVRGLDQLKAYWPDSDSTTTDKINLREGRYMLQGYLHFVAAVDANGKITNPGARHMVDWFLGNTPESPDLQLPFDVNEIYATRGVVPQCAMKVTHDGDSPVFSHYAPPKPCHCDFQVLATGNASVEGCAPCKDASACRAGQQCSYGYCE